MCGDEDNDNVCGLETHLVEKCLRRLLSSDMQQVLVHVQGQLLPGLRVRGRRGALPLGVHGATSGAPAAAAAGSTCSSGSGQGIPAHEVDALDDKNNNNTQQYPPSTTR